MKLSLLALCFQILVSISLSGQELLSPEAIAKLMPTKVKGYNQDGDLRSSMMKMGDLRYTLCERRFTKNKQSIKILLFDYKEASIMYQQAMKRWTSPHIVTDSVVFRNISSENYVGWESFNRVSSTTQIFVGVKDRFFIMISADNVELASLQEILATFPFQTYPK